MRPCWLAALAASVAVAAARPARAAEATVIAGVSASGLSEQEGAAAERQLREALVEAGYPAEAAAADAGALARCERRAACVAAWARSSGVRWIVYGQALRLGGAIAIAVEVTDVVAGRRRLAVARNVSLLERSPSLVAAVAAAGPRGPALEAATVRRTRRLTGAVLVGGAVVLAVTGLWARSRGQAIEDDWRRDLEDGVVDVTPAQAQDMERRARRWAFTADGFLAGAGLAAAAGVAFLVWPVAGHGGEPGAPAAAPPPISLVPLLSPNGAGVAAFWSGRF